MCLLLCGGVLTDGVVNGNFVNLTTPASTWNSGGKKSVTTLVIRCLQQPGWKGTVKARH
jgi:hypothetical protein